MLKGKKEWSCDICGVSMTFEQIPIHLQDEHKIKNENNWEDNFRNIYKDFTPFELAQFTSKEIIDFNEGWYCARCGCKWLTFIGYAKHKLKSKKCFFSPFGI